ncbi:hypothetical protein FRC16_009194 [Serendipita sp. 398]|nr:hypothetical protein FRC16_009194 [Serendipita sp. 398]
MKRRLYGTDNELHLKYANSASHAEFAQSHSNPKEIPNMFQAIMVDLPPEQQRPSLHGKKRYDGEFILFLCNCKIIVATGRYGRLDNGDYFDVSIGRLGPNIDVGRVIHPDFHRILTIREAARSQGFPDRVEFECVGNSVSRITQQIGNSVPPPIAAAIGREIQKAWLEDMEEHNREGSVSL